MKYSTWLADWMENYVIPSAKPKTVSTYYGIIENHIKPTIGEKSIEELSPLDIQRMLTTLLVQGNLRTGGGLSTGTVNLIISVIQSSLRSADELAISENTLWKRIKRPRTRERHISCFSRDEQMLIERAAKSSKDSSLFGVKLCLYTGLRLGELLALEWDDIDLERGELFVNKTCHDRYAKSGYERVVSTPKTATSQRTIPIPDGMCKLLRRERRISTSRYVISDPSGDGVRVRTYQRRFQMLQKSIGIAPHGFHSLRHTFATRALECGMDVKTLSEILGHANTAITLNRYVHSLPMHKREMMDKLSRLIV